MKILIVTVSFPYPATGAEQLDRAEGIRQLVRLGHEVAVITKVVEWADLAFIAQTGREIGARIVTVPYRYSNRGPLSWRERAVKTLGKLRNPLYFDGAAYEYAEPRIQQAFAHELDTFAPDVVWFEYTYLWPLYGAARRRGVPIITRSINFEPEHFLEEDGRTLVNYLKYVPKFLGEWLTVRRSDVVLAITPKEEKIYARLGAKNGGTLPLRGLPRYTTLPRPEIRDRRPLCVFFMGSSYNVAHNRAALSYILKDIAPEAERRAPGEFIFHVLGSKVPKDLEPHFDGTLRIYEGPKYKEELDAFIRGMDIALVPSLMGAGQQQKVFEPLTRGIPTITSTRAIADYPLEDGVHYLNAHRAEEFVEQLLRVHDTALRERLSHGASVRTRELFSGERIDRVVRDALQQAVTKPT